MCKLKKKFDLYHMMLGLETSITEVEHIFKGMCQFIIEEKLEMKFMKFINDYEPDNIITNAEAIMSSVTERN